MNEFNEALVKIAMKGKWVENVVNVVKNKAEGVKKGITTTLQDASTNATTVLKAERAAARKGNYGAALKANQKFQNIIKARKKVRNTAIGGAAGAALYTA